MICRLSVVVLFHHGEKWIDACVNSLEKQSLSRNLYEIILVDNGGSTPSVKKYRDKSGINVICFDENRGFAEGCNRAIREAHAQIIFLVNQDVVVHFRCFENLLSAFDSNPKAGVISANMVMTTSNCRIDRYADISSLVGYFRIHWAGFASYQLCKTNDALIPVDFISGNGMGFRTSVIESLGCQLFDARLGSYAEDLDFSFRFKRTTWQSLICRESVLYHLRDDAFTGSIRTKINKFIHVSRNRLLVYYHNLGLIAFLKRFPLLAAGLALKAGKLDNERHFNMLRFCAASVLAPIVIIVFIISIIREIGSRQS